MEPSHRPIGRHRYGGSTCGMRGPLYDEASDFKRFHSARHVRTDTEQSGL